MHTDAESTARRASLLHLADSAKIHTGPVCELFVSSERHDTTRLMRSRPRPGRTNSSATDRSNNATDRNHSRSARRPELHVDPAPPHPHELQRARSATRATGRRGRGSQLMKQRHSHCSGGFRRARTFAMAGAELPVRSFNVLIASVIMTTYFGCVGAGFAVFGAIAAAA